MDSTALVCSPVASNPPAHAPDFRPADRPASRKTGLPQDAHATGSATAPLAPSVAPFPSAKFRRSAELISATNAPLKFSAALRPSWPHPSRQYFQCRLAAKCKLKRTGHASCVAMNPARRARHRRKMFGGLLGVFIGVLSGGRRQVSAAVPFAEISPTAALWGGLTPI
jgi:hypothetical protein